MKKTKNIILDTALALFNSSGLSRVTLRTIANEMGISQGNLNYHFKKRADIIEALYLQLVQNIDESLAQEEMTENILHSLFMITKTMMENFYEYRFFFTDFVQIMRENEEIKKHYAELTILREQQFGMFFNLLIEQKLMRPAVLPNEYENLYKRLSILGDFWISSALNTDQKLDKKLIAVYADILGQAIFPYLTEKGAKEYRKIVLS